MSELDLNSTELVKYIDELPFWSAPFGIKLLDGIHLKHGISALDIGFGAGFPLTEIAMRLGNSCTVYGLDPWEAAKERALGKIAQYGIGNVEILLGKAENIPLGDNCIDLITSNNGLNNVSDFDKALSECVRVLKSGGQFIQSLNLEASMVEFYEVMKAVLQEMNLLDSVKLMYEQIYHKRRPLHEIRRDLEDKGFKIKSIMHHSFEYRFVDGTTLLQHYFIRLAFLDGWKEIVPEEDQEEVLYRIENQLNHIAKVENGVKLTIPFVIIDCEKE